VPGGEAALAFEPREASGDVPDLVGRLRLGDRQAVEPGVHGRVDVVGEQGPLTPFSRQSRRVSPRPGDSTFTTSAPKSAS
jgi:hypothetical protein